MDKRLIRKVKIGVCWLAVGVCFVWTGWDFFTNKSEPFHVLMLSWAAIDFAVVQMLLLVMTRRDMKEGKNG